MEIGGLTKTIIAPPWADGADAMLRVCRAIWRQAVFRDAEETVDYSLHDHRAWAKARSTSEFFVCRDLAASESWDQDGPTEFNKNMMLHFLVQSQAGKLGRQICVIYDDHTAEMEKILAAFESAVRDLWGGAVICDREAA